MNTMWSQPLNPLHSMLGSALAAAVPLAILLVLMGMLRKSGYISAAWGLASAGGGAGGRGGGGGGGPPRRGGGGV